MRVEQRVDPAAAWNSLEKAARAVDDHAAAMYAHFARREEQAQDGVDGLPLAKALADWECQEDGVPVEEEQLLYRGLACAGQGGKEART